MPEQHGCCEKLLHDKEGRPLYFGDMKEDKFLQARDLVDKGQTFKILDL